MFLACQRTSLIHKAHTSLGTGHPGTNQTLSLLQDRFWWPVMATNQKVRERMPGMRHGKDTPHLPSGKLLPLYRGPQFISRVCRSFSLLGVTISLSSGYHPQSNSQTERKIQEMGASSVPSATATRTPGTDSSPGPIRTELSRQPSTDLTPFQCVLCYQPLLFPWSGEPS